jgi:hypothetical protein
MTKAAMKSVVNLNFASLLFESATSAAVEIFYGKTTLPLSIAAIFVASTVAIVIFL